MRGDGPEAYLERHFTVSELAELWHVSRDTVRRLFRGEPDVLKLYRHRPSRRPYTTLLIPASVAARVHKRLSLASNDFKLYNSRHMSTFG